MDEKKYSIIVDNETVAQNVTLDYALIFVRAIFEKYFAEYEMQVVIAPMPRCKAVGQ